MSTKRKLPERLAISIGSRCKTIRRSGGGRKAGHVSLSVLCLIAGFFGMSNAFAFALYTVGSDAACSFNDLQQAIDASIDPEGNSVLVAQNMTFSDQHVVITDRDVNILGGLSECSAEEYIGQTTINGTSGASVFEIEGNSHVYVANLLITGAVMDADHSGGGIYFGGQGSLELANTSITNNEAGYGGGIDVSPSGGPATLTLYGDTLILNNTALVSGGGIRIEGDTRLYVLQPNTLIDGNHAQGGYGGGIEVLGPARADIGSPGYGSLGVIFFNDAQYGGGIAALAINDGESAVVNLFTTDPNSPVQISDNFASATGGAVYLKPRATSLGNGFAAFCAYDFRIHDNVAQEGSAIYADLDNTIIGYSGGSSVGLNSSDNGSCTAETPPDLGGVACAPGVPCNEINDNVAADANGEPTPGSAILVQSYGDLFAKRFSMRRNQGAHALRVLNDEHTTYGVNVHTCLFADNVLTGELAMTDGDVGSVAISGCTFANNQIGAPYVLLMRGVFSLWDSIVDEPGRETLDFGGGTMDVEYVLSNDTATLGAGAGIIQGEPTFVDAANGDYHLQATSLGIDFGLAITGNIDLDGNTRTVDLPGVPNTYGPLDLGAYEIQLDTVLSCANADTIYCDGFEG